MAFFVFNRKGRNGLRKGAKFFLKSLADFADKADFFITFNVFLSVPKLQEKDAHSNHQDFILIFVLLSVPKLRDAHEDKSL